MLGLVKTRGTVIDLSKPLPPLFITWPLTMNEVLQNHTLHTCSSVHICNRSGPHVPIMNVFLSKAAALFELKMCTAGGGGRGVVPAVSSHCTLLQGSSLKAFWMETECSIHSERGSGELEKTGSQQKSQPFLKGGFAREKEEVFLFCPWS